MIVLIEQHKLYLVCFNFELKEHGSYLYFFSLKAATSVRYSRDISTYISINYNHYIVSDVPTVHVRNIMSL